MAIQPADEPSKRVQVMVVGLGMVGIAFIEKMLTLDTAGKYFIRTCGEEPMVAYNRVGLTEYFQHRNVSDLYLNPVSWYAEQNPEHFAFHIGEQVLKVDPAKKEVHTSKDNVFKYDILVLATGSAAGLPPYVSADRARKTKGVFVYRSIADLESIIKYAEQPHVTRAEVIGGGLLGLEAAKAVYDIKIPNVSIHIRQDYPLNRQLDASAGMLVLRKIEDLGVKVYTKSTIKDMTTSSDGESDVFTGFQTASEPIESDLVIYAVGIKPRDDLAGACGIELDSGGGVKVGDDLMSSEKDVYAIGECASWRGNYYGLIGPGIEQADILSFNLTQTHGVGAPKHAPRKMNTPDLSTRLKLMGVDVASFGDHFADMRVQPKIYSAPALGEVHIEKPSRSNDNDSVKCLTYHDPFSATYKKYIFSQDGQHLLGGMMIGDVGDFAKLVGITKKKKKLEVPPSQFILGAKADGETNGDDLDDDTTICSCHNVAKGAIVKCVKDGITDFGKIKAKTKVGAGCGGCVPLATSIFKAEMKKLGHVVNNNLCHHIKMSRQDLMMSIKIKKLKTFREVMDTIGVGNNAQGCEVCKPAIGSILSTLYNEHVMLPKHHGLQDTNDRFMANIQRDGTFSVVPRVQGGEIAPDKLIAIGQVAKEFNLYTKITGALRIDMFGAKKQDLPAIWEKLIDAGLESGQAYGKTLRSVKSCVGSTWCRFGLGDSVGLAIDLENRYKGVRSPHKFKGGVSGCVRECAEAQGKDFGLIATDKGWNIFVGGNGGMTPRHAQLLATDVPPTKVIRIIDRYLMLYIRTADKLQRTARWVESFDGGIEKLKKIILEDELGICAELEAEMQTAIGHYEDEWRRAVNDPELRKQFRQFVNTSEHRPAIEKIDERGQQRPADWPQQFPTQKFEAANLPTPKDQWKWIPLATVDDLLPTDQNTTSAAVRYGDDSQLAIFHVPGRGYYATQQMCPHKRAFVLDHGIVGDDKDGNLYVSCPLHKRNYRFDTGECTNDADMKILAFDVKEQGGTLLVKLPPTEELDEMIGSSKWMVKKATAEALGRIPAGKLEIVPPLSESDKDASAASAGECATNGGGCGSAALDW